MTDKKTTTISLKKRNNNIFIGALLGLYHGVFYRPAEPTEFSLVVGIAVFAALVTVIIRTWKKKLPFKIIGKEFSHNLCNLFDLSAGVGGAEICLRLYGKPLVIVVTTAGGAVVGWLFSHKMPATGDLSQ
jgi:hypothetical protein